jgi:hypothetical protein
MGNPPSGIEGKAGFPSLPFFWGLRPETRFPFPVKRKEGAMSEFQDYRFVLGPNSEQMRAIETLLREAGMPFGHATFFGRRVTKENARMANGATIAFDEFRIAFVECDGPVVRKTAERGAGMLFLGHTRPGDPGYAPHPHEIFPKSSLGQVIEVLAGLRGLPRMFKPTKEVSEDIPMLWHSERNWSSGRMDWFIWSNLTWHKVPDDLVRLVEKEHERPLRRRATLAHGAPGL